MVHEHAPFPVVGDVLPAQQEAGEEQQRDDVRRQRRVGHLHAGAQGGDQVRQNCGAWCHTLRAFEMGFELRPWRATRIRVHCDQVRQQLARGHT